MALVWKPCILLQNAASFKLVLEFLIEKKGLEDVEELSDCLLLWIVDVDNDVICYFFLWWVMGMGAVCVSNTPSGHKPWGQQGLKLKIGIHHLMASTEWVLSDDWKLWHNAQWGSCINHFRVLRSAAFNIRPVEKLFSQFDSFLLFPLLSAPVVWWSLLVKWWTSKLKSAVSLLFFIFWEKVCSLFPPSSLRLFRSKSKPSCKTASTLLSETYKQVHFLMKYAFFLCCIEAWWKTRWGLATTDDSELGE